MRNEATQSINISASCCIVIRVCGWRKIWLIHKIHNNIWRGRGLSKCVGGGRVLTRLRLRGTMLRLHRIQYGSLLVRHRRIVLYTTPDTCGEGVAALYTCNAALYTCIAALYTCCLHTTPTTRAAACVCQLLSARFFVYMNTI